MKMVELQQFSFTKDVIFPLDYLRQIASDIGLAVEYIIRISLSSKNFVAVEAFYFA